jgi:hypothetical protein
METPVTDSSMKMWETATGHIADVLTQIIGLSSATLAVVVTFRVQLKGGPSWLLKVAFASFAICIGAALISKTTIYRAHALSAKPEGDPRIKSDRRLGGGAFWLASGAFSVALTALALYAILAIQ